MAVHIDTCRCRGFARLPHDAPASAFYPDRARSTGRSYLCRACHRAKCGARNAEYYARRSGRRPLIACLDYRAVAWHNACRVIHPLLREVLRSRGLWEDIEQTVALAAWIASRDRLDMRCASNCAQRLVYGTMREIGYRRPRGDYRFVCDHQVGEEEAVDVS